MTQPTTWKLINNPRTNEADVVWREWPDGRQESCLVTAAEYLKWLDEGNEPLAADES
jgi:hypothetical protein